MANVAPILVILLVNQIRGGHGNLTQFNSEMTVTDFSVASYANATIFALQIQEIRSTSDATAAASSGSNLNVVPTTRMAGRALPVNFLEAILERNKEEDNKNQDASTVVTIKSLSSKESKQHSNEAILNKDNVEKEINKPMSLVSDECIETTFIGETRKKMFKDHNDLVNIKPNTIIERFKSINERTIVNKEETSQQNSKYKKHNNGELIRIRERQQHKSDIKKESSDIELVVPTIPITTDFFDSPLEDFNLTLYLNVTENVKSGYTEAAWFETKDKSKIRFSKLPQRESYLIPTLKLEEGLYPFGFMSDFFALMYPFNFPVGQYLNFIFIC